MSTSKAKKNEATVQDIPGGYHLVTYNEWQVSVMNDGMISLPRIVRPQDIDDFCAAMAVAKDVGLKQQAENEEKAKKALPKPGERGQRRNTLALSQTRRERNAAKAKIDASARQGGPRNARRSESKKSSTRSNDGSTQAVSEREGGEEGGGGTAGS